MKPESVIEEMQSSLQFPEFVFQKRGSQALDPAFNKTGFLFRGLFFSLSLSAPHSTLGEEPLEPTGTFSSVGETLCT